MMFFQASLFADSRLHSLTLMSVLWSLCTPVSVEEDLRCVNFTLSHHIRLVANVTWLVWSLFSWAKWCLGGNGHLNSITATATCLAVVFLCSCSLVHRCGFKGGVVIDYPNSSKELVCTSSLHLASSSSMFFSSLGQKIFPLFAYRRWGLQVSLQLVELISLHSMCLSFSLHICSCACVVGLKLCKWLKTVRNSVGLQQDWQQSMRLSLEALYTVQLILLAQNGEKGRRQGLIKQQNHVIIALPDREADQIWRLVWRVETGSWPRKRSRQVSFLSLVCSDYFQTVMMHASGLHRYAEERIPWPRIHPPF